MGMAIELGGQWTRGIDPHIDEGHMHRVNSYVRLLSQQATFRENLERERYGAQIDKKVDPLDSKQLAELYLHSAYIINLANLEKTKSGADRIGAELAERACQLTLTFDWTKDVTVPEQGSQSTQNILVGV